MELLRKKGRFFPFGAVVWAEGGGLQLAAAPADKAAANDPGSLLDRLVEELRSQAEDGLIRAAGTCVDVRGDPELGQAIRTDIEDANGEAGVALVSYAKTFPRRFTLSQDVIERPGVPRIFA